MDDDDDDSGDREGFDDEADDEEDSLEEEGLAAGGHPRRRGAQLPAGDPRHLARRRGERRDPCGVVTIAYLTELYYSPRFVELGPEVRALQWPFFSAPPATTRAVRCCPALQPHAAARSFG